MGDADRTALFVERVFGAAVASFDVFSIYLGQHLGYYAALAEGPMTSSKLAEATSTDERYTREWLEQQAVTAILEVDDATAGPFDRTYRLPPEHAEVLLDRDSPNYVGPLGRLVVGVQLQAPAILDAYRSGAGIGWEVYGDDVRDGQGEINRPFLLHQLGKEYLSAIPRIRESLTRPGAKVADIGCGVGWSSIGIALTFPETTVDGYDLDAPAIEQARTNARDLAVHERVSFHVQDASDPELAGSYDLAAFFECLHDMPDPVGALRTAKRLVGTDGAVLIMDERVADTFTAPGDDVERIMYGWSITVCLPGALTAPPAAGTGTVMRASTAASYAKEAGFSGFEVLPLENDFFRFYLLTP